MTDYPLRAHRVGFSYRDQPILSGMSLEVERGEMVGLVGPNGAGKTTFLKIVTGILSPDGGEVFIQGSPLTSLRARDRARLVAMVHQNPTVPIGFSAFNVVMMGRNPHLALLQWEGPRDMDVCRRVMELTGTAEFAQRHVTQLSGGELQRVFIARALAQETPVLVLDEPTAHLDISYQTGVLDMIETIRRETGVTVLLAMHDLTLAAQYCDRVAVLHRGSVFANGRPSAVLTPEVVSQVFGATVSVVEHPVHGTPVVLPVSREVNGRNQGGDRRPDRA